jgi:hypothetical protein
MKKQLEIATIKANSASFQGCELYWLISRNQLEFLFKELEVCSSPPYAAAAKYQEIMLPVINLEKYYGLAEQKQHGPSKYLVVKSVNDQKELVKVIVETPQPLKIQKLAAGPESLPAPELPKNSENVLGMYGFAEGKLGIVPDFAEMSRSLQLKGNGHM